MTSALSPDDDERRASLMALSALHDGEALADEGDRACRIWRQDAAMREAWHTWSLVGDVLRSDDLAQPAQHDADFLRRFRERLADEPVVLAPSPLLSAPAQADRSDSRSRRALWRRWTGPAAVAAGFMAVAGALVVLRTGAPGGEPAGQLLVKAPVGKPPTNDGLIAGPGGEVLVQNPDLQRYLAAHRQFAQGPSLAAPGGVRQVVASPNGR